LTWLPRVLSSNVRFIATGLDGEASRQLSQRPGFGEMPLPPLTSSEAHEIVTLICQRYHRKFDREVIDALLARGSDDGLKPVNPLWLVIATEDLNLIDADDFELIHGKQPENWDEQVRAYLLDMISQYPADVAGLYVHTFKRAEKHFDKALPGG